MKEKFEHRKLTGTISLTLSDKSKWVKDKAALCQEITAIIARYGKQGYVLTLRQLYYQLVASGAIRNDDVVYKKMSGILDDLRYSGAVDWSAIEDRGRVPFIPYSVKDVEDAIQDTIDQYRLDRQEGQPIHIEVWTEKDAISGILKRVTREYHVKLVVNKGYSSSSAMHGAYSRFSKVLNDGREIRILYFGDHDPSGLDMLRDIRERILFFIANGMQVVEPQDDEGDDVYSVYVEYADENHLGYSDLVETGYMKEGDWITLQSLSTSDDAWDEYDEKYMTAVRMHYWAQKFKVIPIGLTMEQIKRYNPPPNPAKISDPRAAWYIEQNGEISWEVDALPPDVMAGLVQAHVEANIDLEMYEAVKDMEKVHIAKLKEFQALSK